MATRTRGKPFRRVGLFVKTLREAKGLNQIELAERAAMRNERISEVERGFNVEIEQYDRIARGLGYRDMLDMFRSGNDALTRKLLRYWSVLDDGARKDVLAQVKGMIDVDEG